MDIERFEPYESAWRLPYVGQKPLRLKHVLLWQGLTFALMFHFSISTNIVKKGNFRNKVYVFSQIIAINIVIVVNSRQAIIVCILVAYTIGDIVLSFHYILYLAESNIYNSNNRCQIKYKLYC